MQERQVTVEGETFPLPEPFHVLATANPIEYEGTYPLPEAQLDRFLLRVSFGYPTVRRRSTTSWPAGSPAGRRRSTLDPVTDAAGLRAMQAAVETVHRRRERRVATASTWPTATREHRDVLTGSSPRGSLGLVLAARAFAVAPRPRLRHPRGRQGGRPAGALAPDHGEARALDDPGQRRRVVDAVLARGARPRPRSSHAMRGDDRLAARPRPWAGAARRRRAGIALAVLLGRPVLVVLVAPFLLLAAFGLLHRPSSAPRCRRGSTTSRCTRGRARRPAAWSTTCDDVEHVTRVAAAGAVRRAASRRAARRACCSTATPTGSRRSRSARGAGAGATSATRRSASPAPGRGYRWGPVPWSGSEMVVLPTTAPFDSRGEAPQPIGPGRAPTAPAGRRRDRVRRDPAVPCRRPAAPDQLAGLAAHRRPARRDGAGRGGHRRPPRRRRARRPRPLRRRRRRGQQPRHDRPGRRRARRALHPHRRPGLAAGRRARRSELRRLRRRAAPPADAARPARPAPARRRRATSRPTGSSSGRTAGTVVIVLSPDARRGDRHRHRVLVRRGLPVMVVDTLPDGRRPGLTEGTDPTVAAWPGGCG